MAEPYYTTANALRTALGLDNTQLTDAQALALIQDAEDWIDGRLGARPLDPVTGRAVLQADVSTDQWTALGRATIKVATAMRANPKAFEAVRWNSVKGPDFAVSGPTGRDGADTAAIKAALRATGLRQPFAALTGSACPPRHGRPRGTLI